jgi:anti-anti-sigma factor
MGIADYGTDSRRLVLTRSVASDGGINLAVGGEIDIGTVDQLRAAVTDILGERGVTRLVLDFGPLRFIDSSGIAALIGGYRTADERGIGFGITNCTGTVRHVLEVTGVYDALALKEDE